jgi:hypothetical protein
MVAPEGASFAYTEPLDGRKLEQELPSLVQAERGPATSWSG